MSVTVTVEIFEAIQKFKAIINHMANVQKDFLSFEPMLRENIQDNIDSQKNPNGGIYQNLSPAYLRSVAYKNRPRNSPKPMDTNSYRKNYVFRITKSGLEVRPVLPYTVYHESTEPRNKMPLRRGGWFSNKTIQRMCDKLGDNLIRS